MEHDNPERLRRMEELFHGARERDPASRERYLAEACRDDAQLLHDVQSLLANDDGSRWDRPALEAAAPLLNTTLVPGARLGSYEIVKHIGAGGMGEVYEARDTRLGRAVAIKTIDDRYGRFEREAQAISSLNHPHICTLHDVGPNYIVMELLDGETLAARLNRGPLPMADVLRFGEQIAGALAAAHVRGIIHRDLKPGNIMLTKNGVKLLDFGLAKFSAARGPSDATVSLTGSQEILGTPAYMAPEQVEGKRCDERTDIFALGLVLFEMAVGKRAFGGDSRAALMAEVLRGEPPLHELRSPAFAYAVECCLAKNPEERWQNARDVKLQLAFLTRRPEGPAPIAVRKRRLWPAAAAVAVLALAGASALFFRTSEVTPSIVAITSYPGEEVTPSLSPDGSQVVFAWRKESSDNWDIYVKQIGPGSPRQLTNDPASDVQPRWSPDGKWIAFLRFQPDNRAGVYVVPASGGLEQKIGEASTPDQSPRQTLDWSPDGKWLIVGSRASPESHSGLALLSRETAQLKQLTNPPAPFDDRQAIFAPDGRGLAFLRVAPAGNTRRILFLPLSRDLEPQGEAKRILTGVNVPPAGIGWTADGRDLLVSISDYEVAGLLRVSAGRAASQSLDFIRESVLDPFVSRSGDRMVLTSITFERNIWSLDLDASGIATGPASKAFVSTRTEYNPAFSPDGSKVALTSSRSGYGEIWVCASNGSACEQMTTLRSHAGSPQWSPDGQWIAFDTFSEEGLQIAVMSAAAGKPRLLGPGVMPRWSRDSRWIYNTCAPAAQICRMPATGGDSQPVPGAFGVIAQESPDGKWLYYCRHGGSLPVDLRRVPIAGGDSVQVLPEVSGGHWIVTESGIWFMAPATDHNLLRYYDFSTQTTRTVYETSRPIYSRLALSPDHRRVLFTQVERGPTSDLILVENFR